MAGHALGTLGAACRNLRIFWKPKKMRRCAFWNGHTGCGKATPATAEKTLGWGTTGVTHGFIAFNDKETAPPAAQVTGQVRMRTCAFPFTTAVHWSAPVLLINVWSTPGHKPRTVPHPAEEMDLFFANVVRPQHPRACKAARSHQAP